MPDQIKVVEWLRENWEKQVMANKMSAQGIADCVSREKGIEKVTAANIYGILEKVFPQWQLPRLPGHMISDVTGLVGRIDELTMKFEALATRVEHLEKEFGVRPMTSFLGANSQQAKK